MDDRAATGHEHDQRDRDSGGPAGEEDQAQAPGAPTGQTIDEAGRERRAGRPTGVSQQSTPGSEGRPAVVRHAQPKTPDAEDVDTVPDVDRGETPDTEHTPGGDL